MDDPQHPASQPEPILVSLADDAGPSPCCDRAHEQGYRRGYRHGYTYALWDLGLWVEYSDTLWDHANHFLYRVLAPWVSRATRAAGPHLPHENGPRLRRRASRQVSEADERRDTDHV
jgi:hypothetical protein